MQRLTETSVISQISQRFIDQEEYFFDKHVPEFIKDGKFLGDFFSQLAVQPNGDRPPTFYYTYSPFDVISNKAPHRAAVFSEGKMLLETDFDLYTAMRTGAMSAVVLKALGLTRLASQKVLIFGAGNIAKQSVRFLKAAFPDIEEVFCISKSGKLDDIRSVADQVGIRLSAGSLEDISQFDIIICHTQAEAPVLSKAQKASLKQGVFIASFISSTNHGELADGYFNSAEANVICDWEGTIKGAKEIERSIAQGALNEEDIIFTKDLLNGHKTLDQTKKYTVYRSTGTPIQNLAILQLLV